MSVFQCGSLLYIPKEPDFMLAFHTVWESTI